MFISCDVHPFGDGFQYTYILPLRSEQGSNLSAIFGSNFNAPNLFTAISETEFKFSGKIFYSPNDFQAFRFYSDLPPTQGFVTLRAEADFPVALEVPVPEPSLLTLWPFIVGFLICGRQRRKAGRPCQTARGFRPI